MKKYHIYSSNFTQTRNKQIGQIVDNIAFSPCRSVQTGSLRRPGIGGALTFFGEHDIRPLARLCQTNRNLEYQ